MDYIWRATFFKINNSEGFKSCGKGTCQAIHYIGRANSCTTKVCGEMFKNSFSCLRSIKVNIALIGMESRLSHKSKIIHTMPKITKNAFMIQK